MPRTYLITGASGIGAETARMLARGAQHADSVQLFIAARTEAKCQTLVRELHSLGATAEYMVGDLTDASVAPLLIEKVVARFGRLDGVFNVAGISGRRYGDGPSSRMHGGGLGDHTEHQCDHSVSCLSRSGALDAHAASGR